MDYHEKYPDLIYKPSVFLIGQSHLNVDEVTKFLMAEGDPKWEVTSDEDAELLTELAGRVCYMSFGSNQGRKDTGEYLTNIIEMKHGSVLEHANWTFLIAGVSRSFTHELVRHRVGVAFSQLSQRYVDESDTKFVVPPLLSDLAWTRRSALDAWYQHLQNCKLGYSLLTDEFEAYLSTRQPELKPRDRRKRAREAARSLLPNATETKIVFTANTRALRHIIEYRGSAHADQEIQRVARELLVIMQREAPALFSDYITGDDGSISTPNEKI